nr:hypothetical protein [Calditrichia bacterium]
MKSLRFSRITLFPLLLLVASFFFAQSCDKKEGDTGQISYPLETARLVKLVTNGVIAPDDPIRVRFATPVITREQVGSQLKASVFNFEPTIDGIATWEDRDLLVFQPNQSLPLRSQYQGRLDLKALFPLHKDRESLSDLPFRFNVAGREITHLSTDFELVKPADPRQIYAVGDVAFSQPLTLAELQDNSALTRNGKSLNLQWTEKKPGTAYSFRSDALERGERTADFVLTLDGGKLGLPEDLKRPFVLPALQDLAFLNAEAHGETGNATVEIKFSDELDRQMDLNGLVRVEPPVNFTLSKSGNSLILSGDFHSGEKYDLILNKGLRSRFGTTLTQNITHTIHFETLKPRLEFVSDGSILPTANQRRIRFRTLNVRAVFLQVKRVFENNLGQFLQTEQLKGDRDRRYD